MQLKCTVCDARFYSAANVRLDGPCLVPECTGTLVATRNGRLTLVK